MLKGSSNHLSVMMLMEAAPYDFHLTGSRFFGYDTEGSDWDFFVDALSHTLEHWLMRNGFYRETPSRDYSGRRISQVWKHERAPIHVQVVEGAQLKADVQDAIQRDLGLLFRMKTATKEERKLIWETALVMFAAGKKVGHEHEKAGQRV